MTTSTATATPGVVQQSCTINTAITSGTTYYIGVTATNAMGVGTASTRNGPQVAL